MAKSKQSRNIFDEQSKMQKKAFPEVPPTATSELGKKQMAETKRHTEAQRKLLGEKVKQEG